MVGRQPIKCIGSTICCGCTDVYRLRYALLLQVVSAILGLGHYLPRRPPPESLELNLGYRRLSLLHLNSSLLCIKASRVVHNPPSKVLNLRFRQKRTEYRFSFEIPHSLEVTPGE